MSSLEVTPTKLSESIYDIILDLQVAMEEVECSNSGSGGGRKTLKIGIIGGSGFYDMPELTDSKIVDNVTTEFGSPSDNLVSGFVGHVPCVVLGRWVGIKVPVDYS